MGCISKILLSKLREFNGEKAKTQGGCMIPRKQFPSSQHGQYSQELTKTNTACTWSFCVYYGFKSSVFNEIPECVNEWVSDPGPLA